METPAPSTSELYDVAVRDAGDRAPVDVEACFICGDTTAEPRYAVDGLSSRVVACRTCGLGKFHPLLDEDEVGALYPQEYYGGQTAKFRPLFESLVRMAGARHVDFLCRDLQPGARVLDVGCGRGVVLTPLADRGFEVHGVEVNEHAAAGADPRAQIRIAPNLADAGYEEDFFDEVIIWHVLEHVPEPRTTLEEIRRILRPGGRLIVAVPNFASAQARWSGAAWFHLDLPRHLFHFPLPALEQLLRNIGFHVHSAHHFSLSQNPFGWIQSALNRRDTMPRNALYSLLHHGSSTPFPAAMRLRLWALLALGTPPALIATVLAAAMGSGATVHVVATK